MPSALRGFAKCQSSHSHGAQWAAGTQIPVGPSEEHQSRLEIFNIPILKELDFADSCGPLPAQGILWSDYIENPAASVPGEWKQGEGKHWNKLNKKSIQWKKHNMGFAVPESREAKDCHECASRCE